MDRVIFCPTEDMMEEAKRLSRLHIAPVLLGDNERTKNLSFDRSKPLPLMIPTHHYVKIVPQQPVVLRDLFIYYFNDFVKLPEGTKIKLLSERIGEPNGYLHPRIIEAGQHRIFCVMVSGEVDNFKGFVYKNDEIFDTFEFSVVAQGEK